MEHGQCACKSAGGGRLLLYCPLALKPVLLLRSVVLCCASSVVLLETLISADTAVAARPRVKASQCYTKYKWRDEKAAEAAGGPAIVATQVRTL